MRKTAGDALKQAFMSREDYESLPVGDKIWDNVARPALLCSTILLGVPILSAGSIITAIVFEVGVWPSCSRKRVSPLPPNALGSAYRLTQEEAALFVWMAVFVPTAVVMSVAMIYLAAGITVAYTAPKRHFMLKVVENSCCASKRGGVRCLSTLNLSFMVVFILMALFLGSSIVTLDTACSLLLFWCYEALCWGMVFLLGVTAFFLHRKAALVMDHGEIFGSRTVGMEMLEAAAVSPTSPEVERRVRNGFRSWMGSSSLLSSDDEEDLEGESGRLGLDDEDVWERQEPEHVPGVHGSL